MFKNAAVDFCAGAILTAYDKYENSFDAITRRAKARFEQRDWRGGQSDAKERLLLYDQIVDEIATDARKILNGRPLDEAAWKQMKSCFSEIIEAREDRELARTFYNSIMHRLFSLNGGVNPETEYAGPGSNIPLPPLKEPIYRTYYPQESTAKTIEKILLDCQFQADFENLPLDVALITKEIETQLWKKWHRPTWKRIEILKSIFYRSKGAYIIGRIWKHQQVLPVMIALLHNKNGIFVDTVLTQSNEISIVFSFSRSYFHVEVARPRELIRFLKSILPLKRTAELYISIGHNKHGKRALYRALVRHLQTPDGQFIIAPGARGMVMTVFTLPSFPVVFKIIKDKFDYPKSTTREQVKQKYHLVFKHDRVGRLVDAQEFEYIKINKSYFSRELLDELLTEASQTVYIEGENLIIKHLYTERRLTPLNLYIHEAPVELAQEAVNDYGKAIKDLAAANIFPGDVFLKNFGVTRNGRVVFYDYDELELLTDCNFRRIPQARSFEDEFSPSPWFHVSESDVFPEEFASFIGLFGPLRDTFFSRHADLCSVEFWRTMQERQKSGEIIDIFPYKQRQRFHRDGQGA